MSESTVIFECGDCKIVLLKSYGKVILDTVVIKCMKCGNEVFKHTPPKQKQISDLCSNCNGLMQSSDKTSTYEGQRIHEDCFLEKLSNKVKDSLHLSNLCKGCSLKILPVHGTANHDGDEMHMSCFAALCDEEDKKEKEQRHPADFCELCGDKMKSSTVMFGMGMVHRRCFKAREYVRKNEKRLEYKRGLQDAKVLAIAQRNRTSQKCCARNVNAVVVSIIKMGKEDE